MQLNRECYEQEGYVQPFLCCLCLFQYRLLSPSLIPLFYFWWQFTDKEKSKNYCLIKVYHVCIQLIHPHTHKHKSHYCTLIFTYSAVLTVHWLWKAILELFYQMFLNAVFDNSAKMCAWHYIICRHRLANWIITIALATCTLATCMPSLHQMETVLLEISTCNCLPRCILTTTHQLFLYLWDSATGPHEEFF